MGVKISINLNCLKGSSDHDHFFNMSGQSNYVNNIKYVSCTKTQKQSSNSMEEISTMQYMNVLVITKRYS